MDTSTEYIKMCDCSEIQDRWKRKSGDWVFYRSRLMFLIDFIDEIKIKLIERNIGGPRLAIWDTVIGDVIFFPRQDQIQEMMGEDELGLLNRLDNFYYFCVKLRPRTDDVEGDIKEANDLKGRSIEQLWLAFYMHETHNKVWNGEAWIENN